MSGKIFAIMSAVDNQKSMLENNLMVEVEKDSIGLNVTGYEIYLEPDNPSIITSNANGFPLWLNFQCTNQRFPNLRNRYFDIVRALGLKEMWLMWEDLVDYFDSYAGNHYYLPRIWQIIRIFACRTYPDMISEVNWFHVPNTDLERH